MRGIEAMVLLTLLGFGGCLEIEQTVTLRADGSGEQQVHMVVREQLLAELQKRQPAVRLSQGGDPRAVFDEEMVRRELAAAGLEMQKHEVTRVEAMRAVDLTATFADFRTLQKSPLAGSSAEWVLDEGPKPGLARLTFYPQGKEAWLTARAKAKQMKGQHDPLVERFFQQQKSKLAGLDVALRLRLPGKVYLWTRNLEKVSDTEVVGRVTAAQIKTPNDLIRRLAPRYQVVFDARGTALLE
ncbi:MAG TPA: hypothetical protein ENI87_07590 [bacterium]|nr:hypothetical protein [bacterium]